MKIPVGISNRHIHLNKSDKDILFGSDYELQVKRSLKQMGEYASTDSLNIVSENNEIDGVRVIGPLRNYTQVEIMKSDAKYLGLNPPVRNSGNLSNSESITLVGPKGNVYLKNAVIIANRHIHMTPNDASYFKVNDDDIVNIKKDNILIDNVHIKIGSNYVLECHLDKDDELKYGIHTFDEVEIVKQL